MTCSSKEKSHINVDGSVLLALIIGTHFLFMYCFSFVAIFI